MCWRFGDDGGLSRAVSAQADYPFRDPKLGDDARIADLLDG